MSNDNIYLNNCKTIPFEKLGLVTDYVLEKSFANFISEELLCAVEAVAVNSRFFSCAREHRNKILILFLIIKHNL